MLNVNRTVLVDPGNNGGLSAGSVHRYDNVINSGGITVYALVRVLQTSNAAIVTGFFDDETQGLAIRFQPRISTSAANGFVKF